MRESNNQIGDEEEAKSNTEKSGTTESNTANTCTETMTDGGTETIRSRTEVKMHNDDVRYYSADGHLYAYREGDEHIVVSRGREPRDRWTKRVPAERDAVLTGEHLWTIPDNWQHRVKITFETGSGYAVYHIPETGVDVLVSVPSYTQLVDAWYSVKRVGTLSVTYDDEFAWDKLEDIIETVREREQVDGDVVDALERLHRRRRSVEKHFVASVNMYAKQALLCRDHEPITVRQWTADPWIDIFHAGDSLEEVLDLDNETKDAVVRHISDRGIIPLYPTVRVDVESDEGIPDGYEIRAMSEIGAPPAEVVDYLITEYYDLMSQDAWAGIRDTEEDMILKNVGDVKKKLSS
ncbi:hypothetical protein [Natrialbaceae archaeon AArc-T1-2]|uniref:hypothetical protein n=1 Tax=Natrialbaceae archaeon AArc-T1-2 TaxID=3053904 RepID=UPI00255B3FE7|nr:hypothetical protein [Natrialbaceae archaeon AArc-T1-2]WIV67367.1 hypothetical protein QQ977_01165 [Natrialbaceae archaeon AArc-T1-2]